MIWLKNYIKTSSTTLPKTVYTFIINICGGQKRHLVKQKIDCSDSCRHTFMTYLCFLKEKPLLWPLKIEDPTGMS